MAQAYAQETSRRGQRLRIAVWAGAAAILTLPLVAMQFTREVRWTAADFAFAAVLLFGSLGAFELSTRRMQVPAFRVATALLLLGTFLLIWINAAVGIIGEEGNPANLMFAGVLGLGAVGAVYSRFRPTGMARTAGAMAAAQIGVALIAFSGFAGSVAGSEQPVLGLTAVFTLLWLAAAALFARAVR